MKHTRTLCIALLFLMNMAQAQHNIPEKITGNWINVKTNNWEYGFFERFAIYKNHFWEYDHVSSRNNQVLIKLKNGSLTETLKVAIRKNNESLVIANSKGKSEFKADDAGPSPHNTPDHQAFKNSGFKSDTVTIIGYYRNLDKYLREASGSFGKKGPFEVSVPDFIQDDAITYYADFDSLGRFSVKFPVVNSQQIYLDWGRLTQLDVVEPGETIFLFADLADYIPDATSNPEADWKALLNKPKQILYMGEHARLHNELAGYHFSMEYFNRREVEDKTASDLEYLNEARSVYENRVRHLEDYIKRNPSISHRFRNFQYAFEKYQLLVDLMQHRFDKREEENPAFESGYMAFIDSISEGTDEIYFTLLRDYASFIRDYIGYHEDIGTLYKDEETGKMMPRQIVITDADVLMDLKERRNFSEHDKETVTRYSEMLTILFSQKPKSEADQAKVTEALKPYAAISAEINSLVDKLDIVDSLPELRTQLLNKKMRSSALTNIDTLIDNNTLKQLLIAQALNRVMEQGRIPLSKSDLVLSGDRITIQPLRDYIMAVNNYYVRLSNTQLSYSSSLKNTDHLKESKDAEILFQDLISPYKGNVIYLDFWGTWCGPCRQQMSFVGAVKKELEDKKVIFMYLANNSPEKTWENLIKQMNLTGPNVVHYRLPDEQQAMIERKFSVKQYPTYLLFDKEGNLVRDDAPRPELKAELIGEINKLLVD